MSTYYTGRPENIALHLLSTFPVPKSRNTLCIFPECGDAVTELAVTHQLIHNDVHVEQVWLMDRRMQSASITGHQPFDVNIFHSYAELCHALHAMMLRQVVPTIIVPGVHQQQMPYDANDAADIGKFMMLCGVLHSHGHMPHPFLNYMSYGSTHSPQPLQGTWMTKSSLLDPHTCVYLASWKDKCHDVLWRNRDLFYGRDT